MKPRQFTDPEVDAFNEQHGRTRGVNDYLTVYGPFDSPEAAEDALDKDEVVEMHDGKYYCVDKR